MSSRQRDGSSSGQNASGSSGQSTVIDLCDDDDSSSNEEVTVTVRREVPAAARHHGQASTKRGRDRSRAPVVTRARPDSPEAVFSDGEPTFSDGEEPLPAAHPRAPFDADDGFDFDGVVSADITQRICRLCKLPLEISWDTQRQELVVANAVLLRHEIFHEDCMARRRGPQGVVFAASEPP